MEAYQVGMIAICALVLGYCFLMGETLPLRGPGYKKDVDPFGYWMIVGINVGLIIWIGLWGLLKP